MAAPQNRIPELDGLRGIAVLAVIGSHYAITRFAPLFSAGWAGVNLFFVLSGFLITTILRRTSLSQRYYRTFWRRRALRIWPLGYAVFFSYYMAARTLHPGVGGASLWIALGTFTQAIIRPPVPVGSPLWLAHYIGIAWSLSVEEWFYVGWAPIVRLTNRSRLMYLCITLILVEPAIRAVLHRPGFPEYFLLVSRADSLAWGALVALWLEDDRVLAGMRDHAAWLAWAAFATAVCVIGWTNNGDRNLLRMAIGGYTMLDAACGAVLVAFVARRESDLWPARLCRAAWLRYVGIVSYGMYMFHMPAFDLTRWILGSDGRATRVLAFTATLAMASISWRYFEGPLLRMGHSDRSQITARFRITGGATSFLSR